MASLASLPTGISAEVVRVDADPAQRRRLLAVGLRPGAAIEVLRRALGGDPLEVLSGSVHLMLRAELARTVWVRR